jgi:hypothetical protein
MTRVIRIEVDEETAEALRDKGRRARVGRLVNQIARLYKGPDPLAELLERTSQRAQEAGLTDQEVDAELAAYNAERRG